MNQLAQDSRPLANKVAIVTGASRGIGAAICENLAKKGANLVLNYTSESSAQRTDELASKLSADHNVKTVVVRADMGSEDGPAQIVRVAREIFVRGESGMHIDIIVNNAGITGKTACLWDLSRSDLDRTFAVNLTGPFLLCRAVLGKPAAADGSSQATGMFARKFGRIVNIASIAGKEGNPTLIPYSASKAALINLTKALAKECVGRGPGIDICVNSISPAVIRTAMVDAMPKATVDYMISKIPMGRTGRIGEVAALVHFLASNECSFTTGQCYDLSGGRATY